MYSKTMSILAAAALCTAATGATADSHVGDRQASIAKLEASADELAHSLDSGPRVGALDRHEARQQLQSISEERERLSAGGTVDRGRIASLTGEATSVDPTDPTVVSERLSERQAVVDRRVHGMGPRMGAIERAELREDLSDLDALIADVEQGRDVDLDRVDRVIGLMQLDEASTARDRRDALEIQRASDVRQIHTKVGAMQRVRIRQEIDEIDRTIQRLETQI
jgi:hypothetical protein